MKKYMLWYGKLSDGKKVAIQFAVQWLYWGLAWLAFAKIFPDEKAITLLRFVIRATIMAVFMTAFTNQKKIKRLFNRRSNE